jgi:hypothetical protein
MGKHTSVHRQADVENKKRRGPPPSVRIGHIRKWLQHHYGHTLPNDTAGRDAAFVMCSHLANGPDAPKRIRNWLSLNTPWMMLPEREAMLASAIGHPYRWNADKLAHTLGGVTDAVRERFGLWTIGAVDVNGRPAAGSATGSANWPAVGRVVPSRDPNTRPTVRQGPSRGWRSG